ncbi:MAG: ABC transporter permease [Anaerolineae bacterium]|nr:MAG: ABC transporter permease [Anaerolineae bacterium]
MSYGRMSSCSCSRRWSSLPWLRSSSAKNSPDRLSTMISRILALVKKEFIHLRNDWWLPAFMLIGGLMELIMVAWATSRPITNLPILVVDYDRSAASRQVVTALENTGTFNLLGYAPDEATVRVAVERGEINAAVIIPPDFNEKMTDPDGRPQLVVILNGAESIPATEALRAVQGVAAEINRNLVIQRLGIPSEQFEGFDFSLRVWFNEALKDAFYTTPAEFGLMLEFVVLLFAALTFARERELGTLEQLLVMPFSSLEIIIGKSIPVLLISYTDFLLMLIIIRFVFGLPMRGSLALLLLIAFGYMLVELGKGLVISVVSHTQHQAFLLVMLVGMTDFMFTGYAAPVEGMPKILQWVANVIPANHWLTILRGIMLKGAGLDVLWPNLLALIVLGAIILTFSLRFVRRALD